MQLKYQRGTLSVRWQWEHFYFLPIGFEKATTESKPYSSTLSKLTSKQPHLLPPYARSRDRFGLSWETLILSDAFGLSSVWWGQLLVEYLHRPCWRSGAAEGPVVGVVFKGKRTKDPEDSCGAEALSLKNRSTAGEETPWFKIRAMARANTTSVQNEKQRGWIKWNVLSKSHLRSFSQHMFQFICAKFSMLGKTWRVNNKTPWRYCVIIIGTCYLLWVFGTNFFVEYNKDWHLSIHIFMESKCFCFLFHSNTFHNTHWIRVQNDIDQHCLCCVICADGLRACE